MNLIGVVLLIFLIRIASVFIVQTFYVPDEYWQSVEVAHKIAFGYGYLTWEWREGLRSYLYPLIFAGAFKVLVLLQLDGNSYFLTVVPRLLQAILSAYSDYRFFVWCGKKKWALFSIVTSWFWFYIASRTLTNTLEASLTTIALSYFPWQSGGGNSSNTMRNTKYVWIVALCCFIRPTAVLLWAPLILYHMGKSKAPWHLLIKRILPICLIVCAVGIGADCLMYKRFIITPYEFLKYNLYYNIGSFYGSHKWYWYLTNGLPSVLGISYIPFLLGSIDTIRYSQTYPTRKIILVVITMNILTLSVVEHKEFRFLSSLLPLCLYIISDTLTKWSYKASRLMLWCAATFLICGNAVPALYFSRIHQRGPIEAINRIHDLGRSYRDEQQRPLNVLFLMPCHSTPYYSHIHQNITMRFLTCDPNLSFQGNYKDEADIFYESPKTWLRSHIPSYPRTAKPTHLVLYDTLAPVIHEFLTDYKLLYRIFNGEFGDKRTGKFVLIYQRLNPGEENMFNRDVKTNEPNNKKTNVYDNLDNKFEDDGNIFN